MCLAIPGMVVSTRDGTAIVDFQGNRQSVDVTLTPDARAGDWVLVHAGFAITRLRERDALETWECLRGEPTAALLDDAGGESAATRESEP